MMRILTSALLCLTMIAAGGDSRPASASGAKSGGHGTLVAVESLDAIGESCMVPSDVQRSAVRAIDEAALAADAQAASSPPAPPVRRIRDPYAAFAAISVDVERNEVVVTDENLFQILVYGRTENTPADADSSRPKRAITGDKTDIEFQSGVYVDPATGEIYAANNDTRNKTVVFAKNADGNVAPVRDLETPHGTFGITIDEKHQELILTVQHDSAIVVYRKAASGEESPIRVIQGDQSGLADPHGVAVDPRDDLLFTANYGSTHKVSRNQTPLAGVPSSAQEEGKSLWPLARQWGVPGSGTISPGSIVVHRRTATGNAAPVRVIQGPATQLNWPTGLAFDAERRELFVANDMGPSILVFDAEASGNAAPKRVIKGRRTGLANPTGIVADTKNREVWVTNFGGHSAAAFDITAEGDVAPRRVIRSAPPAAPSLMIGNPGAVAFDTKREELLVPN